MVSSPNPFYVYPFPEGTTENPVTTTSNGSNPFYGGDKAITDLKDWIDAVETLLLDIGGGPYWYSYAGSLLFLVALSHNSEKTPQILF